MALERTLRLENLNGGGWGEHWVTAVASWLEGIENLRGGIESGDKVRAHSAFPHVVNYFAWAERHWPGQDGRHIVSTQAAECYACLSAMNEPEAMVLASRICSPYMAALEHEFGADDKQNVVMRRFLSGHCGNCGKTVKKLLLAMQARKLLWKCMPEDSLEGTQEIMRDTRLLSHVVTHSKR